MTPKDIILLRDREVARTSTWRSVWQKTADLVFPRENQIDTQSYAGSQNSTIIWDNTAQQASKEMSAGMSVSIFPSGQKAFALGTTEPSEQETRYLARATEMEHEEMFASNLMLELNEALRSWGVFGTCNLFTEWTVKDGLVYKDYDISLYQILENADGVVDTILLTLILSAKQAVQKFETIPDHIQKAADKEETSGDMFEFIHYAGPRTQRNRSLSDGLNMPFEDMYIDVEGTALVQEGGYEHFPYAVARYSKRSTEVFGRGQGTDNIRTVEVLQQMTKDMLELQNKLNNPPLLVHQSFEGRVNLSPGAQNTVMEMDAIKALQAQAIGSHIDTVKAIEMEQEVIHRAFYKDIFNPLRDITARMTAKEVAERMREGYRLLAPPVARLQRELLSPLIMRSFLLLVRNGVIPPIPESLLGRPFKIEYQGPLALALKNQQASAFQEFAFIAGEMSAIFPEAADWVGLDKAMPDLARARGVKEDHIPTREEVDEIRRIRAEQQAAMQALEASQQIADAYGKTTSAPEEGSAAGKVMEAVG